VDGRDGAVLELDLVVLDRPAVAAWRGPAHGDGAAPTGVGAGSEVHGRVGHGERNHRVARVRLLAGGIDVVDRDDREGVLGAVVERAGCNLHRCLGDRAQAARVTVTAGRGDLVLRNGVP